MFNISIIVILITSLITPFSIISESDQDHAIGNEPTSTPLSIQDPVIVEDDGGRIEHISKRTENTKFYSTPEGLTTAEIFMQPIHYIDENGLWQDLDLQIQVCSENDNYDYENVNNGMKVFFKNQFDVETESPLKINRNEYSLTWTPINMETIAKPTFNEHGNSIIYQTRIKDELFSNSIIKDEYIVKPNELKHNYILPEDISIDQNSAVDDKAFSVSGTLTYPTDLKIFTKNQERSSDFVTSSNIELRDWKNDVIFKLPTPYAYEQENSENQVVCNYKVEFPVSDHYLSRNKIKLTAQTPVDWLTNSERTYPVVIDPTITLPEVSSDGIDTYIEKGNQTAPYDINNSNFGKDPILRLTRDDTDEIFVSRILAYFDVSGIDPIAEIKNASLKLRLNTGDDLLVVSAFRITHEWVEGNGRISQPGDDGATWLSFDGNKSHFWAPGGDRDSFIFDTIDVQLSAKWYWWDITEMVQGWVDQIYSNYGVMLVGTEGDYFVEKEFSSSEGAYYPRLEIQYNTPPVVNPDLVNYKHKIDEDHPTHFIDLNHYFYDPDSDDNLDFKMWTGTEWKELGVYENEFITVSIQNNESLKFEPEKQGFGTDTIKLKAIDKHFTEVEKDLQIEVKSVNDRPEITVIDSIPVGTSLIDISATEGRSKNITMSVEDKDYNFGSKYLFSLSFDLYSKLKDEKNYEESEDYDPLIYKNLQSDIQAAFSKKGTELSSPTIINLSIKSGIQWDDWKNIDKGESWWDILDGKDAYRIIKFGSNLKVYELDNLQYEHDGGSEYNLAFGSPWFQWSWTQNDGFQVYEKVRLVFRPTNSNVGEVYFNVSVFDKMDANFTAKLLVDVINDNNPPINPSIVCIKDGKPCTVLEFTTSETIRLEGEGDDPDLYVPDSTESLRYEWSSNIQGDIGNTKDLETKLVKGNHEITLKIIDKENEFIETSIMINVRNVWTIDDKNCTCAHDDALGDVISYSYRQYKTNGTSSFAVQKGKFSNIDIIELGTDRDESDLLIYLTVDGEVSNKSGYEYEIFLVKSFHMEEPHTLREKYNRDIYESFYEPDGFEYYAKFTLEDGEISEEDPSTMIIITDLGDLEAGDGTNQPLEADFDIFAIAKYNNHDPSGDPLKHDMAYDSAGHGNATAPSIQKEEDEESIAEAVVDNLIYFILIVIIIIVIVAVIMFRSRKSRSAREDDTASDEGVIYDTSQVEIISPEQAAMARQAPPHSTGVAVVQAQPIQQIGPPTGIQQQPYQYQQPQQTLVQQPQPQPVHQEGPVVQLPDQPPVQQQVVTPQVQQQQTPGQKQQRIQKY
jgi:hypothetical protein